MAAAIDFKSVFESIPTPLVLLAPDMSIVEVNHAYAEAVGRAPVDVVGRNLFDAFPSTGETARGLRNAIMSVLRTGEPSYLPLIHYPVPVPDESGIVDRYWSATHMPIRGADGEVAFVLQNTQDVTAMHRLKSESGPAAKRGDDRPAALGKSTLGNSILQRAERVQALNLTLLAESAQLRNLFMRAPSFMCLLRGPEFRFELANSAYLSLVGQRQLIGRTVREALPEVQGQGYIELLEKVFHSGEPFVGRQMRVDIERTAGAGREEVFIDFVYQPIRTESGEVIGIFVDGNDVTDHVRAVKSQAMLVRELHHRVRNTLATVQGVMNSTARTAETIEEYQWAFSGRISSLARTHSLLTEEIQQFVSFPSLLRQEVGVYAEGDVERVVLEGPDVELPSQLAVPLGMTIHELSTNAFRHGALSRPEGRVTVTWTIVPAKEKRILTCRWVESGGPEVLPPERQGFGSMILTRVLSQQIGAKVDASYGPEGFELTAEIPLDIERA